MGKATVTEPSLSRRLTSGYARAVTRLRWPILLAVGAILWAALGLLPGAAGAGGGLSGILSTSGPAIQAQIDAVERFGLPLLTRVAVVQRDPAGLNPGTVIRAAATRHHDRAGDAPDGTAARRPGRSPCSRCSTPRSWCPTPPSTTPRWSPTCSPTRPPGCSPRTTPPTTTSDRLDQPDDAVVGVAGAIPAQIAQGTVIGARAAAGRGGHPGRHRADRRAELPLGASRR